MKKQEEIPMEIRGINPDLFTEENTTPDSQQNAVEQNNESEDTDNDTANNDTENNNKTQKRNSVKNATDKKRIANDDNNTPRKSAMQQLREFIGEDEDQPLHINVQSILRADGLGHMLAHNWAFIIVIVFFTCCYVTSRYMMESAVLENNALTDTLLDRRYKALTISSQLLENTLSSHVEENLSDTTIHTPTDQAFKLNAE